MTLHDPNRYTAIVLRSALKLYAKTGMKANRAYTPTKMMKTAARITGQRFAPRDYMGAHDALTAWLEETK